MFFSVSLSPSTYQSHYETRSNIFAVFQGLGGAYLVSGAQAAFINQMILDVMKHAPSIDKGKLILTGATEIRNVFSDAQLPFVIDGYMKGLKVTFAMAIAATGITTLIGLGTRWKKLNPANLTGGMA